MLSTVLLMSATIFSVSAFSSWYSYDTPENYRKRYDKGEIKCKETFEKREVSTEPKFVQERRSEKLSMGILSYASIFEKENEERL